MAVAHSFLVVSVRSVLARPTSTFFLVVFLVLAPTSVVAKSGGIGEIFGSLIGRAAGEATGKVIVDPKTTEITLQKMTVKPPRIPEPIRSRGWGIVSHGTRPAELTPMLHGVDGGCIGAASQPSYL